MKKKFKMLNTELIFGEPLRTSETLLDSWRKKRLNVAVKSLIECTDELAIKLIQRAEGTKFLLVDFYRNRPIGIDGNQSLERATA